jgi:hypothetical protein
VVLSGVFSRPTLNILLSVWLVYKADPEYVNIIVA